MATIFKTNREFLNAVIKADVSKDITEFAKAQIAALDKKNANRKVSKSALAHKAENDGVKSAILAQLVADKPTIASDLATAVGVSTQKISALAKQLVEDGFITVCDVKVPKKGKVKGYTLVASDDVADGDTAEDSEDIAEDGEDIAD